MEIRLATEEDIPRIQEIFRHARQFMADKGNPNQWTEGYPAEELIREDIAHGDCFVCLSEGRTVATFVLRSGVDPTYTVIYDGSGPTTVPTPRSTVSQAAGTVTAFFTISSALHSLATTPCASTHIRTTRPCAMLSPKRVSPTVA